MRIGGLSGRVPAADLGRTEIGSLYLAKVLLGGVGIGGGHHEYRFGRYGSENRRELDVINPRGDAIDGHGRVGGIRV